MRRPRSPGPGSGRGFSLIELLVVMAVAATVLSLVVFRIDGLSPKYALRAAAREVGATIDLARGTAAAKGTRTAIEYDIDGNRWLLYGPPAREGGDRRRGAGPWGLDPIGDWTSPPRGVRLKGVYAHEKGRSAQERGEVRVRFDPLSIEGSHIVYLENDLGKRFSVKFNALLGSCDYAEGIAEFEAPPDN